MLDLRAANRNRFTLAKRLWAGANSIKLAIFIIGSISVLLTPKSSPYIPQILLVMAIASEILQWRSDVTKGDSEALLRKLDFCSSFGRTISEADKRDIVSTLPAKLRRKFDSSSEDTYFDSHQAPGPDKAIRNLIESAWYTKKLTETMAFICAVLISLLLAISFVALFVSSRELSNVNARESVSKVVTSWLLLIFTLGLAKNAWLYSKMAQKCSRVENSCEHLLQSVPTETDALKQWHEYQVARSSCPLIPDLLWNLKRSSLEDAWQQSKG